MPPCPYRQGCIKHLAMCNKDGLSLRPFSFVLVLVLVLEGRHGKVEHEDDNENDRKGDPQTLPEALVALARPSLMQPCPYRSPLKIALGKYLLFGYTVPDRKQTNEKR